MIRLTKSLNAWGTPDFKNVLKEEIEQLGAEQLPLQQGLSTSSYALGDKLRLLATKGTDLFYQANSISINKSVPFVCSAVIFRASPTGDGKMGWHGTAKSRVSNAQPSAPNAPFERTLAATRL